jgi:hypothetical protein
MESQKNNLPDYIKYQNFILVMTYDNFTQNNLLDLK